MKYSWEIWKLRGTTGLWGPLPTPRGGYDEAESPEALAERLAPSMAPGQRLNIWDTVGVGKLPVLTVNG